MIQIDVFFNFHDIFSLQCIPLHSPNDPQCLQQQNKREMRLNVSSEMSTLLWRAACWRSLTYSPSSPLKTSLILTEKCFFFKRDFSEERSNPSRLSSTFTDSASWDQAWLSQRLTSPPAPPNWHKRDRSEESQWGDMSNSDALRTEPMELRLLQEKKKTRHFRHL